MFYTHVAAALIGASAAGAGIWNVQAWRYEAQIQSIYVQQHEQHEKSVQDALARSKAILQRKDEAIHEATKRAQANAVAAASARTESDRLRDELSAERSRLSAASCASVREHAATLNELFGNCSRALEDLAGKAQGHASDALMFEQAWPTAPKD